MIDSYGPCTYATTLIIGYMGMSRTIGNVLKIYIRCVLFSLVDVKMLYYRYVLYVAIDNNSKILVY